VAFCRSKTCLGVIWRWLNQEIQESSIKKIETENTVGAMVFQLKSSDFPASFSSCQRHPNSAPI